VAAVLEHAKFIAQTEIDGAASELLGWKLGRDLDLAFREVTPDIDVGKNHLLMISGDPLN